MHWLIMSIVVPAAAGPALFWIIWLARWKDRHNVHPFLVVKDGQLGWATIAVCSGCWLEVPDDWSGLKWLLGALSLLSTTWCVLGAVEPVPYPHLPMHGRRLWRFSLVVYVLASAVYAFVHLMPGVSHGH
ncbi:hypothetical protein FIV34_10850 [Luteibacter pinisoli]|uniref:Uncharacterized protein n=1 Tax=Luteibacter pinisoli TaxID=2589080 RepID=A0A4Y5Z5N0_9GAMM|nr:hypothetical protein FIV34_10850 [Luteibacter pinisoli]